MPYTPNNQHRNAQFSRVKSQWSIPLADEVTCFHRANLYDWAANDGKWGLHIGQAGPYPLGVAPPPASCELHIAKFVHDTHDNWHGYPVAHWLSPFDKPDQSVLIAWVAMGLISRPSMAKIHRGKKCAL